MDPDILPALTSLAKACGWEESINELIDILTGHVFSDEDAGDLKRALEQGKPTEGRYFLWETDDGLRLLVECAYHDTFMDFANLVEFDEFDEIEKCEFPNYVKIIPDGKFLTFTNPSF